MSQPVKYMTLVIKMMDLYQTQLLSLFKKFNSAQLVLDFKQKFEVEMKRIKDMQADKSIQENKVSETCQYMNDYFTSFLRPKKTSQSERYAIRSNLKSQDTMRMRFTGGLKKNQPKEQISQLDQIVKSYKIDDEIAPKMRMKWKSFQQGKLNEQQQPSTIGNNNIDLLSYTIPQIQNSIKRLSVQSKHGRRSPQRHDFDAYRTVDTRTHTRKKYVPRLF